MHRDSWPPILLATATWLSEHDFHVPTHVGVRELRSGNDQLDAVPLTPKNAVGRVDDKHVRFYLVLGLLWLEQLAIM